MKEEKSMSETTKGHSPPAYGQVGGGELKMTTKEEDFCARCLKYDSLCECYSHTVYCECTECDPDQYRFESHEAYLLAMEIAKCDDCQQYVCDKHDRKV